MEIKFHNRITGNVEREIVYGDKFIEVHLSPTIVSTFIKPLPLPR